MDLEEDIPPHHLVRVVNEAINRLDDAIFESAYPRGGRDSYHPRCSPRSLSTPTHSGSIHRNESCEGCPLKASCTKAKGNREISGSLRYLRYKQQARERLRSEEGYALSVRRMIEPESVFGQMKNNRGFRRFLLRGLPKVSLEVGWLSLAHNLLKKAAVDQKQAMTAQG
ncbi:transposase [Brevibacillus laterosporus]|uniref:Transposase n=2 Tax=Brevibacillus laterosporus TaxID=1465 RepID=A0AAP3DKK0_BRELA|nr:transposase [Brevibacillus laterosporus]MBM7111785.1 hypothetical protein [Brevibacillus laterosporus]MCR8981565.1 transposase [Brevibacillus laterosporus]MCZ0808720.1 transposase [Brevibacillus laterosporus]MCZ0827182.1 transposase [Brevibacillus laterosporus]MCZ0850493.1 transposase [Brevibacillus laterosporus]